MTEEEILNDNLSNHIRSVFENYEDTTADEGWALLCQKFPAEEKDRGLFWLWYAASAVVMLCIGLWFIQQPVKIKNTLVKNQAIQNKQLLQSKSIVKPNNLQNKIVSQSAQIAFQPSSIQNFTNTQSRKIKKSAQVKQATSASVINLIANDISLLSKDRTVPKGLIKDSIDVTTKIAFTANNELPIDSSLIKATDKNTQLAALPEKRTSAAAMEKLLNEPKNSNAKPADKINKKTVFSLYAATYFNYAKGSDNRVNAGAGFNSDFRISNRLRLSTGLAVGQNTLNYSNGNSTNPQSGQLYAANSPALNVITQITFAASNLNSSSAVTIPQNYTANLIGLDIPVNLKYQINPQKNDTYVSIGLSSGTFINETYTLNYTLAQNALQSTNSASFGNIYIAKTLNISFGTGYVLGKTNRLIIEPFLKYPLGGLGTQEIKFGAGGINLKINFQPQKK